LLLGNLEFSCLLLLKSTIISLQRRNKDTQLLELSKEFNRLLGNRSFSIRNFLVMRFLNNGGSNNRLLNLRCGNNLWCSNLLRGLCGLFGFYI
jgi:hypothetical protein